MQQKAKDDLYRILKGAIMAGLGATVVFAANAAMGMDFGPATPYVVAIASIILNTLHVATGAQRPPTDGS